MNTQQAAQEISAPAARALEGLQPVPLPETVSFLPQTAAWYVAFAALVILVGWLMVRAARIRRANRYRLAALDELELIDAGLDSGDAARRLSSLTALPVLIKRTALTSAPRADVAALYGDDWLAYLDCTYPGSGFTDGPGVLLPTLSYGSPEQLASIPQEELGPLVDVVRTWIRKHHAPA